MKLNTTDKPADVVLAEQTDVYIKIKCHVKY